MDDTPPPSSEPTRVLITGVGGFVGRHLLAHLRENADSPLEIIATVLPNPTDPPSLIRSLRSQGRGETDLNLSSLYNPFAEKAEVTFRELDICNTEATARIIGEVRPHHIYHLAARASGADNDRDAVFAVNVEGTRNVLEAASNISPFPRVLVVSTGYVYGETDSERPARESDPIGPLWRYGAYTDSKIEMESVARNYRGFAFIVRPFTHIGPGQEPHFAISSFARQLVRIERGLEPPELKVGNLDARRDLLDVRDVVRAYRLLMLHAPPGETFNVALGRPVTLRDAVEQLRALCAVPTQVTLDPTRLRPADIACSTGDAFPLRALTGWQPRFSLDTTLRDILDTWRDHAE